MSSQALAVEAAVTGHPPVDAPVVVIGTGPVGIRAAQELLRRAPDRGLVIYGNEPWQPYNRVRLSSLLAGELNLTALDNSLPALDDEKLLQRHNCPVVSIDRQARAVTDVTGHVQAYSDLVLATGSRAHVPNVPGVELPGVYTFRDLNDAQWLMARRVRSRRTVVLGGGLLGLEAAKAMQFANTEVVVIEHAPRLMARQLDAEAGEMLREHVLSLGLRVILNDSVDEITGGERVEGVQLHSGRYLACDTLVLATGIKPNVELALAAGLKIGRGIAVNDRMQSADPHIYAVGECAEHRGQVYGLVAPGLEQAAVAAHCIAGGASAYAGSIAATRLKVVGRPVFSMGQVGEEEHPLTYREYHYVNHSQGIYRKLVLKKGRLAGAIVTGDWDELGRLQEGITRQRRIWPWQLARFQRRGWLWPDQDAVKVADWPASAIVCNCTGVTRGRLTEALGSQACATVDDLARCTGASSVCGSCKPLLAELLGSDLPIEAPRGSRPLMGLAVLALLAALALFVLAPYPYAESVQTWRLDLLWRDGLWKQISGYTLAGLSLLGLLVSLRKRWKRFGFGDFGYWRVFHTGLGLLVLTLLAAHTGLHLGVNLNFALMSVFLGLALAGGVSGLAIVVERKLSRSLGKRLRAWTTWAHIALFWPLPALLGFHIASVYYF